MANVDGDGRGTRRIRVVGRISKIDTDVVQLLRRRARRPRSSDIIDEDFTGGLESTECLEKLRDGELS